MTVPSLMRKAGISVPRPKRNCTVELAPISRFVCLGSSQIHFHSSSISSISFTHVFFPTRQSWRGDTGPHGPRTTWNRLSVSSSRFVPLFQPTFQKQVTQPVLIFPTCLPQFDSSRLDGSLWQVLTFPQLLPRPRIYTCNLQVSSHTQQAEFKLRSLKSQVGHPQRDSPVRETSSRGP